MTSGRVVAFALLLTPLFTFAQQSRDSANAADIQGKKQIEVAEVEPGALSPATAGSILLPPVDTSIKDNLCYTMRTYVMARDSKDSDSTHPVRYSTCTPANNRAVKKAARPQDTR